jgi:GTP-binding protein Era
MSLHEDEKQFGSVAVLGLPNAGKSTLVNALVGSKVSIVSPKVQTTRSRVLGIAMQGRAQVVLIDTPGVFAPKKPLERAMVKAAYDALDGADIVLHLVDASVKNPAEKNAEIIEKLPKDAFVMLVLNKVDQVKKEELLTLSVDLNGRFDYRATYMVSALKGSGTADVLKGLAQNLPAGEWAFDEDQLTDMPMRLMAAEITREKIFQQLHQELPQAVMVETETWEQFDDGSIKIGQAITVQREGQKAIVLGRGGSRIKQIGQAARLDLEEIFGLRIHLKLFVKVEEDWAGRAENYQRIGLDFQS